MCLRSRRKEREKERKTDWRILIWSSKEEKIIVSPRNKKQFVKLLYFHKLPTNNYFLFHFFSFTIMVKESR